MSSAFAKLARRLRARGAKDPQALAAWIGRKKYGAKKFEKMAIEGERRKHRTHHRGR